MTKPMTIVAAITLALGVSGAAVGCGGGSEDAKAVKRAKAAIATLQMKLKQRLQGAMADGPVAAVKVCADEAQEIRAQVAAETGVTLGRASLRLRNAADAAPDWVQGWLKAQGERPFQGVEGIATAEGGLARVLEPIELGPMCVSCHGQADLIGADIRAVLDSRYPHDAAVGYAPGDLRGAFWAELPY